MTTRVPIVLAAGEGDKQTFFGGGLHTWKLRTEDTEGAFFVFEDVMVHDKCTPLHLHPEADEVVFVLEGEILLKVADEEHHVRAGGMSLTPRGTPHAFIVLSDRARIVTMQTPGIGQEFYRGASEPAANDSQGDVVDLERLQASTRANPRGIEVLGPPPFSFA